jgi:hypothetical protein
MLENCEKVYVKAINFFFLKIAYTQRQVKDKGRRMPIESRKDKRSFNQGKIQQISKVDTKKNFELQT